MNASRVLSSEVYSRVRGNTLPSTVLMPVVHSRYPLIPPYPAANLHDVFEPECLLLGSVCTGRTMLCSAHTQVHYCTLLHTTAPLLHTTAPLLHHYCTTTAPLLHHYCTTTAHYCTTTAPLLHHYCTTTAHYCTTTAPLLHTTAPLLHTTAHYCTLLHTYCTTTAHYCTTPSCASL